VGWVPSAECCTLPIQVHKVSAEQCARIAVQWDRPDTAFCLSVRFNGVAIDDDPRIRDRQRVEAAVAIFVKSCLR
jgi:hypothetical protein